LRVNRCVRLKTYRSAGVKKGLFIFVCEFVHYVPPRRKERHFDVFWLFEHFPCPLAVPVPGTSIGVDLTLGHFKQLLRKPRRIEILGGEKIPHFQPKVAYYRRLYDPLYSSKRTGQPSEDWRHPYEQQAALESIISAGARIVASRT
jgi:hypothetical protein